VTAESVGTALTGRVVGSGIDGRASGRGNVALRSFANTLATGARPRGASSLTFGPIFGRTLQSGRTLADAGKGGGPGVRCPPRWSGPGLGASSGAAAHVMFEAPLFSHRPRTSRGAQMFSEFVATFGCSP